MSLPPFHLAIAVDDLDAARRFYGDVLGCSEGRSAPEWIDFDFFGHQLVVHVAPAMTATRTSRDAGSNRVDGRDVPVPHFGAVLTMETWRVLAERLASAEVTFEIAPAIRFEGQASEQATMFFRDPAGNAIEIKAFADPAALFAKD